MAQQQLYNSLDRDVEQTDQQILDIERKEDVASNRLRIVSTHSLQFAVEWMGRSVRYHFASKNPADARWYAPLSVRIQTEILDRPGSAPTCLSRCATRRDGKERHRAIPTVVDGADVQPEPAMLCCDAVSFVCARGRRRICGPADAEAFILDTVAAASLFARVLLAALVLLLCGHLACSVPYPHTTALGWTLQSACDISEQARDYTSVALALALPWLFFSMHEYAYGVDAVSLPVQSAQSAQTVGGARASGTTQVHSRLHSIWLMLHAFASRYTFIGDLLSYMGSQNDKLQGWSEEWSALAEGVLGVHVMAWARTLGTALTQGSVQPVRARAAVVITAVLGPSAAERCLGMRVAPLSGTRRVYLGLVALLLVAQAAYLLQPRPPAFDGTHVILAVQAVKEDALPPLPELEWSLACTVALLQYGWIVLQYAPGAAWSRLLLVLQVFVAPVMTLVQGLKNVHAMVAVLPLVLRPVGLLFLQGCGYYILLALFKVAAVLFARPLAWVVLSWATWRQEGITEHLESAAAALEQVLRTRRSDLKERVQVTDRVVRRSIGGLKCRLRASHYKGFGRVFVNKRAMLSLPVALESYLTGISDGISSAAASYRHFEAAGVHPLSARPASGEAPQGVVITEAGRAQGALMRLSESAARALWAMLLASAPAEQLWAYRCSERRLRLALTEAHASLAAADAAARATTSLPGATTAGVPKQDDVPTSAAGAMLVLLGSELRRVGTKECKMGKGADIVRAQGRLDGYVRSLAAASAELVPAFVAEEVGKSKLLSKVIEWRSAVERLRGALQVFVTTPTPPSLGSEASQQPVAAAWPFAAQPKAVQKPTGAEIAKLAERREIALQSLVDAAAMAAACAGAAREARATIEHALATRTASAASASTQKAASVTLHEALRGIEQGYSPTRFQAVLRCEKALYTACNFALHELFRSRNLHSARYLVEQYLSPALAALRMQAAATRMIGAHGTGVTSTDASPVPAGPALDTMKALYSCFVECSLLHAAWTTHVHRLTILSQGVAAERLRKVQNEGAVMAPAEGQAGEGVSPDAASQEEPGLDLFSINVTVIPTVVSPSYPYWLQAWRAVWPADCVLPTQLSHAQERVGFRLAGMVAALKTVRAEKQSMQSLLEKCEADAAGADLYASNPAQFGGTGEGEVGVRFDLSQNAFAAAGGRVGKKEAQQHRPAFPGAAFAQQSKSAAAQLRLAVGTLQVQEEELWMCAVGTWTSMMVRQVAKEPHLKLEIAATSRTAGLAVERYARDLLTVQPDWIPPALSLILAALQDPPPVSDTERRQQQGAVVDMLTLLRDADGSMHLQKTEKALGLLAQQWRAKAAQRRARIQQWRTEVLTRAVWRARQVQRCKRMADKAGASCVARTNAACDAIVSAWEHSQLRLGGVYTACAIHTGVTPSWFAATVGLQLCLVLVLAGGASAHALLTAPAVRGAALSVPVVRGLYLALDTCAWAAATCCGVLLTCLQVLGEGWASTALQALTRSIHILPLLGLSLAGSPRTTAVEDFVLDEGKLLDVVLATHDTAPSLTPSGLILTSAQIKQDARACEAIRAAVARETRRLKASLAQDRLREITKADSEEDVVAVRVLTTGSGIIRVEVPELGLAAAVTGLDVEACGIFTAVPAVQLWKRRALLIVLTGLLWWARSVLVAPAVRALYGPSASTHDQAEGGPGAVSMGALQERLIYTIAVLLATTLTTTLSALAWPLTLSSHAEAVARWALRTSQQIKSTAELLQHRQDMMNDNASLLLQQPVQVSMGDLSAKLSALGGPAAASRMHRLCVNAAQLVSGVYRSVSKRGQPITPQEQGIPQQTRRAIATKHQKLLTDLQALDSLCTSAKECCSLEGSARDCLCDFESESTCLHHSHIRLFLPKAADAATRIVQDLQDLQGQVQQARKAAASAPRPAYAFGPFGGPPAPPTGPTAAQAQRSAEEENAIAMEVENLQASVSILQKAESIFLQDVVGSPFAALSLAVCTLYKDFKEGRMESTAEDTIRKAMRTHLSTAYKALAAVQACMTGFVITPEQVREGTAEPADGPQWLDLEIVQLLDGATEPILGYSVKDTCATSGLGGPLLVAELLQMATQALQQLRAVATTASALTRNTVGDRKFNTLARLLGKAALAQGVGGTDAGDAPAADDVGAVQRALMCVEEIRGAVSRVHHAWVNVVQEPATRLKQEVCDAALILPALHPYVISSCPVGSSAVTIACETREAIMEQRWYGASAYRLEHPLHAAALLQLRPALTLLGRSIHHAQRYVTWSDPTAQIPTPNAESYRIMHSRVVPFSAAVSEFCVDLQHSMVAAVFRWLFGMPTDRTWPVPLTQLHLTPPCVYGTAYTTHQLRHMGARRQGAEAVPASPPGFHAVPGSPSVHRQASGSGGGRDVRALDELPPGEGRTLLWLGILQQGARLVQQEADMHAEARNEWIARTVDKESYAFHRWSVWEEEDAKDDEQLGPVVLYPLLFLLSPLLYPQHASPTQDEEQRRRQQRGAAPATSSTAAVSPPTTSAASREATVEPTTPVPVPVPRPTGGLQGALHTLGMWILASVRGRSDATAPIGWYKGSLAQAGSTWSGDTPLPVPGLSTPGRGGGGRGGTTGTPTRTGGRSKRAGALGASRAGKREADMAMPRTPATVRKMESSFLLFSQARIGRQSRYYHEPVGAGVAALHDSALYYGAVRHRVGGFAFGSPVLGVGLRADEEDDDEDVGQEAGAGGAGLMGAGGRGGRSTAIRKSILGRTRRLHELGGSLLAHDLVRKALTFGDGGGAGRAGRLGRTGVYEGAYGGLGAGLEGSLAGSVLGRAGGFLLPVAQLGRIVSWAPHGLGFLWGRGAPPPPPVSAPLSLSAQPGTRSTETAGSGLGDEQEEQRRREAGEAEMAMPGHTSPGNGEPTLESRFSFAQEAALPMSAMVVSAIRSGRVSTRRRTTTGGASMDGGASQAHTPVRGSYPPHQQEQEQDGMGSVSRLVLGTQARALMASGSTIQGSILRTAAKRRERAGAGGGPSTGGGGGRRSMLSVSFSSPFLDSPRGGGTEGRGGRQPVTAVGGGLDAAGIVAMGLQATEADCERARTPARHMEMQGATTGDAGEGMSMDMLASSAAATLSSPFPYPSQQQQEQEGVAPLDASFLRALHDGGIAPPPPSAQALGSGTCTSPTFGQQTQQRQPAVRGASRSRSVVRQMSDGGLLLTVRGGPAGTRTPSSPPTSFAAVVQQAMKQAAAEGEAVARGMSPSQAPSPPLHRSVSRRRAARSSSAARSSTGERAASASTSAGRSVSMGRVPAMGAAQQQQQQQQQQHALSPPLTRVLVPIGTVSAGGSATRTDWRIDSSGAANSSSKTVPRPASVYSSPPPSAQYDPPPSSVLVGAPDHMGLTPTGQAQGQGLYSGMHPLRPKSTPKRTSASPLRSTHSPAPAHHATTPAVPGTGPLHMSTIREGGEGDGYGDTDMEEDGAVPGWGGEGGDSGLNPTPTREHVSHTPSSPAPPLSALRGASGHRGEGERDRRGGASASAQRSVAFAQDVSTPAPASHHHHHHHQQQQEQRQQEETNEASLPPALEAAAQAIAEEMRTGSLPLRASSSSAPYLSRVLSPAPLPMDALLMRSAGASLAVDVAQMGTAHAMADSLGPSSGGYNGSPSGDAGILLVQSHGGALFPPAMLAPTAPMASPAQQAALDIALQAATRPMPDLGGAMERGGSRSEDMQEGEAEEGGGIVYTRGEAESQAMADLRARADEVRQAVLSSADTIYAAVEAEDAFTATLNELQLPRQVENGVLPASFRIPTSALDPADPTAAARMAQLQQLFNAVQASVGDMSYAVAFARDQAAAAEEAEKQEKRRAEEAAERERERTVAAQAQQAEQAAAAATQAQAQAEASAAEAARAQATAASSSAPSPAAMQAPSRTSNGYEEEAAALVEAFERTQAHACEYAQAGGVQVPPAGRPSTSRDPIGLTVFKDRPLQSRVILLTKNVLVPAVNKITAVHENIYEASAKLQQALRQAWDSDVELGLLPVGAAAMPTPTAGVTAIRACGPIFTFCCDYILALLLQNTMLRKGAGTAGGANGGSDEDAQPADAKVYALAYVAALLFTTHHSRPGGGGEVDLGVRFRSRYLGFMYQACPAAVPCPTPLSQDKQSLAAVVYAAPDRAGQRMDKIRQAMTLHMAVLQTAVRQGGGAPGAQAGQDLNPLGVGTAYTLLARTLNKLVSSPGGRPAMGPLLSSVASAQCVTITLSLLLDVAGWSLCQATPPGVGHQGVKAMEALHRVGLALIQSVSPPVLNFPETNRLLSLLETVQAGPGGGTRRVFTAAKVVGNQPPKMETRAQLAS